jgi:hypothetical protein
LFNRSVPFPLVFVLWGLLWCSLSITVCAQGGGQKKLTVSGKVVDENGDPLVATRVRLEGTVRAELTNADGAFSFTVTAGRYILATQSFGYQELLDTVEVTKESIKRELRLKPLSYNLTTVVITPKMNPAVRAMRQVIANKGQNAMSRLSAYEFEAYTRLVVMLDNISSARISKSRGLLKPVRQFMEQTHDSTLVDTNGRLAVPIYINESVSRVYYKRPMRKEVVEANKTTGIEGIESSLLSTMLTEIDVYGNTIKILGQQFESPLADAAIASYRYHLDSIWTYGQDTTFFIDFRPKYEYDRGFIGKLVTSNRDWAVQRIAFQLYGQPPVNWIKNVVVDQDFEKIDTVWVLATNNVELDFKNQEKGTGFRARVVTAMDHHVVARPREDRFYKGEDLEVLPGAEMRDTSYWASKRKVAYTRRDQVGLALIKRIQKTFVWKAITLGINIATEGRVHVGPVDIGEYVRFVSTNPIEGVRFQVGVYTNRFFHERWFISAVAAFGAKDLRFKYNFELTYRIIEKPKLEISIKRQDDLEQIGFRNYDTYGNSILFSILNRIPIYQMSYFKDNTISLSWDATRGLAFIAYLKNKSFDPVANFNLRFGDKGMPGFYRYVFSEFGILARISFREKYILKNGNKIYLGSPFPQLYVEYRVGIPKLLGSQFTFHHISVTAAGKLRMGKAGYMNYTVTAGQIFGKLPFPLLYVYKGNQGFTMDPNGYSLGAVRSTLSPRNITAFYDPVGFNLMYFFEFVADRYVVAAFDWHLGGAILSRIPLIKKLKWAEVVSGRLGWGTLTKQNRDYNRIENRPIQAPDTAPYMEVGLGIENIFRVIRIDFIGRLFWFNPLPAPRQLRGFEYNWGIRINVDLGA